MLCVLWGIKNKFQLLLRLSSHFTHTASRTVHNISTWATTTATATDVTDCEGITEVSVTLYTMRSVRDRKCSTWRAAGKHENQWERKGCTPHFLGNNWQKTTLSLYNMLQQCSMKIVGCTHPILYNSSFYTILSHKIQAEMQVFYDVTLHHRTNSSWHLERLWVLQNVRNYMPNNAASHSIQLIFSNTFWHYIILATHSIIK
jgi:hypothetical protein